MLAICHRRISSATEHSGVMMIELKGLMVALKQMQNYSYQPECTNSLHGNCKEPAENEVTWKIYIAENLDR